MLNFDSDLEAVATAREPFSMGTCLPSAVIRPARPPMGAIAFARPRAFSGTDVSGRRHARWPERSSRTAHPAQAELPVLDPYRR